MKRIVLLCIITIAFFANGYSQNPLWSKTTPERVAGLPVLERNSTVLKSDLWTLNLPAVRAQLETAPARESQVNSNVIIPFPTPDGKLMNYRIYEASVMHPDLAARYPDSKSYVGIGVEDKSSSVRLSTTMFGLHAMIFSTNGTSYVDPYTTDLATYIVYAKNNVVSSRSFECHVQEEAIDEEAFRGAEDISSLASDGIWRVYRLAMASTIEYSAFHVNAAGLGSGSPLAQKKAAVLAAMNVTMTRVNAVYERDMSLTMQLVANNDAVIFIDSDTFDNDNAGTLIGQSQSVINSIIGFANYDIGHTVSTGGGGLASLNSPCSNNKARGITGSPSPVGDPYDIDYVAHEMGHQFGAQHTFNNSCDNNRNNPTAVEPGSGSTIMAYAGICSPNVQNNSDDHFHAVSIAQMSAFVAGAGNCSANVANNNAAPVVNAGADFTIPTYTAFILKGSATDANNDALTYTWEQTDPQINFGSTVVANPPLPTNNAGPAFRSNSPSTSPNRYMPNFTSVLNGNLAPTWEVVPGVARTMNFALTVRDNRMPNGGQTGRDNMVVTTVATGPFRVSSPDVANVYWPVGSTQTVTWDVAGTTGNGINTSAVNILFSSDGGQTFNTVLATATPNDGSHTITLPAGVAAPYCRIMIEAVGNIFYTVSKSIAVGYNVEVINTCNTYTGTVPNGAIVGSAQPGYLAMGTATVPAGDNVVISDINMNVNITHANINDLYIGLVKPGSTVVDRVVYQQGCGSLFGPNIITTFDDDAANLSCGGIGAGNAYKPLNTLDVFEGLNSAGGWRIAIADVTVANSGTLNSWSVEICSTTTNVTLSTESFGFADFSVYPNPNNGNFNVKFDNANGNDVKILVHDLRGRKIFENEYPGVTTFNENVQLANTQSGIYLMTVTDGERKDVKRIVIE
ncbi:MAG: T9SS type A sorting domain-containing protein [Flavobacterium sp.]|nr:T9SS type A sorting domain-containing protein [Flavobacterium sp.]